MGLLRVQPTLRLVLPPGGRAERPGLCTGRREWLLKSSGMPVHSLAPRAAPGLARESRRQRRWESPGAARLRGCPADRSLLLLSLPVLWQYWPLFRRQSLEPGHPCRLGVQSKGGNRLPRGLFGSWRESGVHMGEVLRPGQAAWEPGALGMRPSGAASTTPVAGPVWWPWASRYSLPVSSSV